MVKNSTYNKNSKQVDDLKLCQNFSSFLGALFEIVKIKISIDLNIW